MINLFIVGETNKKFSQFDKIYENTKVIGLEEIRSTQNILLLLQN